MIAFGTSITSPEVYDRCARAGIVLAADPDSRVYAHAAAGSIARSYNLILEQAASCEDLEALVLVHQDAEIVDAGFCEKVRSGLSDPEVGALGPVGATGVRSIAWWDGKVGSSAAVYRYGELGGGELSLHECGALADGAEVDALYGVLMALSPWVVRNIRFDESLPLLHGYDFDLSLQIRAAGRRLVVAGLGVVHHRSLQLINDPESWAEAHMSVAEKWNGTLQGETSDWKERARRAEAGAARLQAASKQLQAYARAQQHDDELAAVTGSLSWRATEPLRRLNALRARLSRAARGGRRPS
jgi:hypothetical protein